MKIHFGTEKSAFEFIKDVSDGKVFVGKYSGYNIWISKVNTRTVTNYGTFNQQYIGTKNLYLTAEQVQQLKDDGYLNDTQLSNIDRIESEWNLKAITTQTYIYQIRWYEKVGIFPKIIQVFRLSCGQPGELSLTVSGFMKTTHHILNKMNHYIFMIHQVVGVEES